MLTRNPVRRRMVTTRPGVEMPTLVLSFPGGRYHATPFGHHVNEGIVEWPPSPWRVVRALIACGYATEGWHSLPPTARLLFDALASSLPRYRLPPATLAHSRHYMPKGVLKNGREDTTLVFDTWAQVGDGVLAIQWDCSLTPESEDLLRRLVSRLGYLGRSESRVEGELLTAGAELPRGLDAYPSQGERPKSAGWEEVALLAPEVPATYADWRVRTVDEVLGALPLPAGKKPTQKLLKERAKAEAPYPVDLLDCLERDTGWWKAHRWSQPPGSRRVLYWRSPEALRVTAPPRARRVPERSVTTMLLEVSTESGSLSALPPKARALPQAELLHRALVARLAAQGAVSACPELTGKDEDGKPLEGHRHAHILPVDLDGDGHLDHILLYAPMGFGGAAQEAIRSVRRTFTKGGVGDLRLAFVGQGDLVDLRRLGQPFDEGVTALLGPPSGSRVWRSHSPFVPPRHLKRRGANTLAGQLLAELRSRDLCAAEVEVLPWTAETLSLRHAVRVRTRRPPPADTGFAIRLVFEAPTPGPLALGYGSHYGLGLFAAE